MLGVNSPRVLHHSGVLLPLALVSRRRFAGLASRLHPRGLQLTLSSGELKLWLFPHIRHDLTKSTSYTVVERPRASPGELKEVAVIRRRRLTGKSKRVKRPRPHLGVGPPQGLAPKHVSGLGVGSGSSSGRPGTCSRRAQATQLLSGLVHLQVSSKRLLWSPKEGLRVSLNVSNGHAQTSELVLHMVWLQNMFPALELVQARRAEGLALVAEGTRRCGRRLSSSASGWQC